MANKKARLGFVLLLVFQFAFSKDHKPQPGYFLNLQGDTVHCLLDFNNSSINPQTIIAETNGSQKEYAPADIKGFGIVGGSDYVSATVTYHTNPISGADLPKNYSDNTETKTCFLKVLNKNVYSLYSLVLPSRKYFFVGSPDKSFTELVYRVRRTDDSLVEDPGYRNQMLALFANEEISQSYFDRISELGYEASAISPLIDVLNEKNTGIAVKKKGGKLQWQIFAGVLQNSFPSSLKGHYTANNKFASQISPTFGANLLLPLPGDHFKIGFSVGYNGYNRSITNSGSYQTALPNDSSTSVYTETFTVKNSLLVSNLYLVYVFNPLESTRFYLKAGVNNNFSFTYNQNDVNLDWKRTESGVLNGNTPYQEHYGSSDPIVRVKNYFFSFNCAAGVSFGRSTVELSYSPPVQLATSNEDITIPDTQNDFKLSTLGICYYFSLTR
jgi:hypothetical protein